MKRQTAFGVDDIAGLLSCPRANRVLRVGHSNRAQMGHSCRAPRVVVENEMDVEFRGHLLFELIEKLVVLFTTMARQAVANDLAVEDVEGGEQCRSPVPLVVVRLALR